MLVNVVRNVSKRGAALAVSVARVGRQEAPARSMSAMVSASRANQLRAMRMPGSFAPPQMRAMSTQLVDVIDNEIEDAEADTDPQLVADLEEAKSKLTQRGLSIKEQPGHGVVKIYGTAPNGEKVVISFDCQGRSEADVDTWPEEDGEENDSAAGARGSGAAEGAEGEEDEEEAGGREEYPFQATVTRGGAKLVCECTAGQDGAVFVHNVQYVPAGASEEDEGLYAGPVFEELAPTLQHALTTYLYDCHVDSEVGYFVALYSDVKEQQEYINWLNKVKSFVRK